MKIKMNKLLIVLLILAAAINFGCSRADSNTMYRAASTMNYGGSTGVVTTQASLMAYNEAVFMHDSIRIEESFDTMAANLSDSMRKLIKQAYIRIRVDNLNEADIAISVLLNKYNAYSAMTETEENSRYYSLRVPERFYDDFLSEMNGMGRLIRRSENTEDVTLRYYDLEGRLEMKRTLLKTFQEYLTRARTIDEILSVEARIAELQYDIEGTAVQLRNLSNRIDYATIDLSIQGPVSASQTGNETLGERIKQLLGSFGGFLSSALVVIIGIIIFGIPVILLLTFLFWLLFGRVGLLRKLWMLVKVKR